MPLLHRTFALRPTLFILMMGLLSSTVSAAKSNDYKVKILATQICGIYSSSGIEIAKDTKRVITQYMAKHKGIKNLSGAQILTFLNANKNKMNCTKNGIEVNYMKVAFDRSAHNSLFEELLVNDLTPDDESVLPDMNAVSYTGLDGKPETVLDYMDRLIQTNKGGTAYTKQVIDLRDTFIEDLGAKRFNQLPADEQAAFNKARP